MSWHFTAVLAQFEEIPRNELVDWIDRGWIKPTGERQDWLFAEVDIARIQLVRDLRHDVGIDEEHLGLVLSLLEQLKHMQMAMISVISAVKAQPEPVKNAILDAIQPHGT